MPKIAGFALPLLSVACATAAAPPAVPTIPLIHLATHMEDYRGQTVRVCGPHRSRRPSGRRWEISVPRASGYHPAGVIIVACGRASASRGGAACATGRIARRDGSTEAYRDGEPRIVSSALIDENWYLYAQCRGGGFAPPLEPQAAI